MAPLFSAPLPEQHLGEDVEMSDSLPTTAEPIVRPGTPAIPRIYDLVDPFAMPRAVSFPYSCVRSESPAIPNTPTSPDPCRRPDTPALPRVSLPELLQRPDMPALPRASRPEPFPQPGTPELPRTSPPEPFERPGTPALPRTTGSLDRVFHTGTPIIPRVRPLRPQGFPAGIPPVPQNNQHHGFLDRMEPPPGGSYFLQSHLTPNDRQCIPLTWPKQQYGFQHVRVPEGWIYPVRKQTSPQTPLKRYGLIRHPDAKYDWVLDVSSSAEFAAAAHIEPKPQKQPYSPPSEELKKAFTVTRLGLIMKKMCLETNNSFLSPHLASNRFANYQKPVYRNRYSADTLDAIGALQIVPCELKERSRDEAYKTYRNASDAKERQKMFFKDAVEGKPRPEPWWIRAKREEVEAKVKKMHGHTLSTLEFMYEKQLKERIRIETEEKGLLLQLSPKLQEEKKQQEICQYLEGVRAEILADEKEITQREIRVEGELENLESRKVNYALMVDNFEQQKMSVKHRAAEADAMFKEEEQKRLEIDLEEEKVAMMEEKRVVEKLTELVMIDRKMEESARFQHLKNTCGMSQQQKRVATAKLERHLQSEKQSSEQRRNQIIATWPEHERKAKMRIEERVKMKAQERDAAKLEPLLHGMTQMAHREERRKLDRELKEAESNLARTLAIKKEDDDGKEAALVLLLLGLDNAERSADLAKDRRRRRKAAEDKMRQREADEYRELEALATLNSRLPEPREQRRQKKAAGRRRLEQQIARRSAERETESETESEPPSPSRFLPSPEAEAEGARDTGRKLARRAREREASTSPDEDSARESRRSRKVEKRERSSSRSSSESDANTVYWFARFRARLGVGRPPNGR